jgi:hypothetical protein
LSSVFTQLCQGNFITIERTFPYSRWQLARIEQQRRILSEGTKTLLVKADLPDNFWGHAFMTMVYIRNMTWAAGAKVITWFAITRTMSNLSNLCVFGCPSHVYIDQSLRSKPGDKAFKGIFVGYAFDSLAWLVFNPSTNRVTRIRNVTFDETWSPYVKSPCHTPIESGDNSDDEELPAPSL